MNWLVNLFLYYFCKIYIFLYETYLWHQRFSLDFEWYIYSYIVSLEAEIQDTGTQYQEGLSKVCGNIPFNIDALTSSYLLNNILLTNIVHNFFDHLDIETHIKVKKNLIIQQILCIHEKNEFGEFVGPRILEIGSLRA